MTESNIKYWDIILVDFNPVKWSEISKIRPCIVISRKAINKFSPLVIVIPLTSSIDKLLPFHLLIKKSKSNWLTHDSKALSEQIKSLDKTRITKKLWTLEANMLKDLEKKVLFVINQDQ